MLGHIRNCFRRTEAKNSLIKWSGLPPYLTKAQQFLRWGMSGIFKEALNRISDMLGCSILPLRVQQASMQRMAEPPQDHFGPKYKSSLSPWQCAAPYQTGSLK